MTEYNNVILADGRTANARTVPVTRTRALELTEVIPTAAGFEVVSGTSGAKYLVAPLYSGGAACTCAYAKRQTRIAVECSHVLAVVAFAGNVLRAQ